MKKLCASGELRAGVSLRFPLRTVQGRFGLLELEGFAHRAPDGTARAWLNVCPHRAQPVDLGDGQLFTEDGFLECQAHGAYFDPASGLCVGGACPGRALTALPLEEREGSIWLLPEPVDSECD